MKIDFDTVLKRLDGKPLQVPDGDSTKNANLSFVATEALMAFDPQSKESGENKAKFWALAMRVAKGGEVELTVEEVSMLKQKIGENFAPVVVGPAWELLEQRVVGEA
jgi:hypothetical protein